MSIPGRAAVSIAAITVVGPLAVALPAQAVPGTAVLISVETTFDDEPDTFSASLPGCSEGTTTDGPAQVRFLPRGGVYVGDKEFTCTGGEAGFTLRLSARFDDTGSVGTWVVADAWGGLGALKGSGSLVGIPGEGGILDVYTGSVR